MKQFLKPFDYVFVLRPILFFPIWAVFLAGYYVQDKIFRSPENSGMNGYVALEEKEFIWVGLAVTLLMGAIFILNQVMERNSENKESKLLFIAPDYLTPKAAFIEAAILIIGSIAFGFTVSTKMGVLFFVILLVTGILYSFSPFNWKDKPILGVVANGVGALFIFGAGWLIKGSVTKELIIYAFPYVCAITAIYLYATLPDSEEKKPTRELTFGAKFGRATTVYVGLFFELISLIAAYILNDEVIFYPALFSLPFFIWAVIKLNNAEVWRAIKYAIFFLTLTVCFKWGILYSDYTFFYVLLAVYLISKLYYRLRFGVNYPSLSV